LRDIPQSSLLSALIDNQTIRVDFGIKSVQSLANLGSISFSSLDNSGTFRLFWSGVPLGFQLLNPSLLIGDFVKVLLNPDRDALGISRNLCRYVFGSIRPH
jgi:hypothetical protein